MSMVASEMPSPCALDVLSAAAALASAALASAEAADDARARFSFLSSARTSSAARRSSGTLVRSTVFLSRSAVPTHVKTPSIAAGAASETKGEPAGAVLLATTWHLRTIAAASTETTSLVAKMSHQPAS